MPTLGQRLSVHLARSPKGQSADARIVRVQLLHPISSNVARDVHGRLISFRGQLISESVQYVIVSQVQVTTT